MARTLAIAAVLAALSASTASAAETTLTHARLVDRAFTICAAASNGIARVRPALTFAGAADATAGVLVHLERLGLEVYRTI